MRESRVRLWHLMLALALVVICARILYVTVREISIADDHHYEASSFVGKTWKVGLAPTVIVDNFAGSIEVIEGSTTQVTAEFHLVALTKISQLAADSSIDHINIQAEYDNNVVTIVTRPPPNAALRKLEANVRMLVPPGSKVEVRTNIGHVLVGQIYDNKGRITRIATALQEVKARATGSDSYVWIELDSDEAKSRGVNVAPSEIDAECQDGTIRIVADDVVVNARAVGLNGLIDYYGSLGKGEHSFVATGAIRAFLRSARSYQIDAKAPQGTVINEFRSDELLPPPRATKETMPAHHESKLVLRSTSSISIRKFNGKSAQDE
jgi:hypothetical protein